MIDPRTESIQQGGELVEKLYSIFDDLNAQLFDNELPDCFLDLSRTLSCKMLGCCGVDYSTGRLVNRIAISRALLPPGNDDWQYISDALTHEMAHALVNVRSGFTRMRGDCHGSAFAGHCRKLSPLLGLDGRRIKSNRLFKRKKRGHNCKRWPFNLRSIDFQKELARLTVRDLEQRQAMEAKRTVESNEKSTSQYYRIVDAYLWETGAPDEVKHALIRHDIFAREAGTVRLNYLTGGEG